VDQHDQSNLSGEIENAVQRRILQAGCVARDFCRHELLVDREFTNPTENARKGLEHTTNVVRGVHIRGIEARDHGVKTRPLFRRQGSVRHRDPCIGERIVVEWRVRVQIISRFTVAIEPVRPLLLEWDAE
jgi:hypothetical protein